MHRITMIERRRRPRVEATELVRVLDIQSGNQLGHLLDIGYSSLRFFSHDTFARKRTLELRLVVTDKDETLQYIDIVGLVLWSRAIEGKGYCNTAVKIINPCAKSASRITQLTTRFSQE